MERASALVYKLMASGGIVVLALGALLGWLTTRSITRPIAYAVKVAATVAGGDLTQRIDADAKDETGQLSAPCRTMNANLVGTVGHIRAGTETISTAASQIAAGQHHIVRATEQQAASLEETAASMEELASTVKQGAGTASRGQPACHQRAPGSRRARRVGRVRSRGHHERHLGQLEQDFRDRLGDRRHCLSNT